MWSTSAIRCHFWSPQAPHDPSAINQHHGCPQLSIVNRNQWSFYPLCCSAAGWWSSTAWEAWSYSSLQPTGGLENTFQTYKFLLGNYTFNCRGMAELYFWDWTLMYKDRNTDEEGNDMFVGLVKSFRYIGLIIVKYQMRAGSHLNSLSQMV